jgi:AraC-like DNA-binding protein
MNKKAEIKVSARKSNGLLFEKYKFSSGAVEPWQPHVHLEYQLSITAQANGEYLYRGGKLQFPPSVLAIIHTGERHAPNKLAFDKPESYGVMYIAPDTLLNAAREIGWQKNELPYFKDVLFTDQTLVKRLLGFFSGSHEEKSLGEDVAELDFLTYLTQNFAQNITSDFINKKHPACIKLAREYLDANFASSVSLNELARIAKVGKYYLCREFRRLVGFSPHQYQNNLRMNSARKLLLKNKTLADISQELGYCDQSHFGRNFKRYVGIPPKFYPGSAILF